MRQSAARSEYQHASDRPQQGDGGEREEQLAAVLGVEAHQLDAEELHARYRVCCPVRRPSSWFSGQ